MSDITQREFLAKILPDLDQKRQGRYKVHIPELMPHIEDSGGIWVKNHAHNWRITTSSKGEYGQYFPIQPGTFVMVKFFKNDMNSGYISRVVSDHVEKSDMTGQDCTEPIEVLSDRDEKYVIFKTPKKWSIFYVNEDTDKEPNTIYLIYNRDANSLNEAGGAPTSDNGPVGRRTVFRIDESGLSFWTRDNNRVRIKLDDNKQVDGNQTEYIKGYRTKHIDGDEDLKVSSNMVIEVSGTCDVSVTGECNVWGGANINVDTPGGNINLNCQKANYKASKPKTHVRDLGPKETTEYDLADQSIEGRPVVTGNKCDDATKKYNVDSRNNLAEK